MGQEGDPGLPESERCGLVTRDGTSLPLDVLAFTQDRPRTSAACLSQLGADWESTDLPAAGTEHRLAGGLPFGRIGSPGDDSSREVANWCPRRPVATRRRPQRAQ